MWLSILIVLLGIFVYVFGIKPYRYWKKRNIPTLKSWPFVGHLGPNLLRQLSLVELLDNTYKAFPGKRYCGFYNMAMPTLIIRDPDLIKRITIKEFETFPEHDPLIDQDMDPLWSKNLFAMKGDQKWHDMRATLSPSFTSSKMRMMFNLMKVCSKQFSEYFAKQNGIIALNMKDAFTRFTSDVIGTTAFGVTCNSLEHRENEFYLMGKDATDFSGLRSVVFFLQVVSPALVKLLRLQIFSTAVNKYFRGLIKDTIKLREEQKIVRPDMIHLLMEARKGNFNQDEEVLDSGFATVKESDMVKSTKRRKCEITDEDITAQALVFFFAGFDTVSTMMSYASYELAINPDIQQRLREEVDEVLKKSGEFTYENLMGMKYLDMVITETLRKWPPFYFADRRSVKPCIIEPENSDDELLYLKKGTVCFLPIYSIQRDPEYYPNPDQFDPERFSEENRHKIKPFTYLPFGSGPKNCIGSRFALLEGKLIIAEIISKFEIVPVERTQIPIEFSRKQFFALPDDGIWLGLKARNNLAVSGIAPLEK